MPELITATGSQKWKLHALRDKGYPAYTVAFVAQRKCCAAAKRLDDDDLRDLIKNCLQIDGETHFEQLNARAANALTALMTARLDEHFIGQTEIEQFDTVELDKTERTELRELLAQARILTIRADELSAKHKQNINYGLSLIENELLKDKVGFAAFIAGADQALSLVNKFGKALEPLGDVVVQMRTKTELKVEGQKQLETESRPRQIEGPK